MNTTDPIHIQTNKTTRRKPTDEHFERFRRKIVELLLQAPEKVSQDEANQLADEIVKRTRERLG